MSDPNLEVLETIVVKVAHRSDYESFSRQLRSLGFNEDQSSGITCRFRKNKMILDVMPTDSKILGYSNIWFEDGFKLNKVVKIGGLDIKVFNLPYLLASKIEAFKGRGKNHFSTSHDIEDIVTLFDGCSTVAAEVQSAEEKVRDYLSREIRALLSNLQFVSSIDAHVSDRLNLEERKRIIIERMKSVST